jgi:succinyl-CoA synthetase alpha subunit
MSWKLENKIIVQGITKSNRFLSLQNMQSKNISIVAGIRASNFDQNDDLYDFPLFNFVEDALAEFKPIETSLIVSEPYEVLDATLEAIASGIKQIIIHSDKIPPLDLFKILKKAKEKNALILGPGNAGMIIPEKMCLGLIETKFFQPGKIGIINRGDLSLMYELALNLKEADLGESMAINLGNESIIGMDFSDWLKILNNYQKTKIIILIANNYKYLSAANLPVDLIKEIKKPIIAYLPDQYNYKSVQVNMNKMIAEQLPLSFNNIESQEKVINSLKKLNIKTEHKLVKIIKLINEIS